MRALITQREGQDVYGENIDILEARYVTYFTRLGLTLYPVSNYLPDPVQVAKEMGFDSLILTGGGSVPEQFYSHSHSGREQRQRDRTERMLTEYCFREKKPILAICRGMQFINGLLGGKVSALDYLKADRTIGVDHSVDVGGETWLVNQYHNDGIYMRDLAKGLELLAIDRENDVVEAFTGVLVPVLALQWHPERPFSNTEAGEKTVKLIQNFLGLGGDRA